MVEKRKRASASVGTSVSPSKKKIIVSPQYKRLSACTLRRIRKNVPKDVKITKIEIDVKPSREMKQDIEKKLESIRDEHKVGLLVGIKNDSGVNHAVAIYRWGDVIYCFDPHGPVRVETSDVIFGMIKGVFGCEILKNYTGANLQAYDEFGVCVGLSSNFIMVMANRSTHLRQKFSQTIKESLIGLTMSAIEKNLQTKTVALSKPRSSKSSKSSRSSKSSKSLTPMNINKKN